jgi:uncharacterized protein YkwD
MLAVSLPGCSKRQVETSAAKPTKTQKHPVKQPARNSILPATPAGAGASMTSETAGHPTDSIGEKAVGPSETPAAHPEAFGDDEPADDSATDTPSENEPGPDDSASDGAFGTDPAETEKPATSKPADTPPQDSKAVAADLTEREQNLAAAKASLTKESEEKDKERFFSDALSLTDDAIAADDFAVAARAAALAMDLSPSLADTELAGEAVKSKRRVTQYEAAFRRAAAARETLAKNATDPVANSGVGTYLCFLQGKWDEGLPHLAKGEDPAVKKAATLDLAKPTTTEDRQATADAWWAVAGRQEGISKAHAMLRAREWYDQIRRSSDSNNVDAEKQEQLRSRIEMIDKYAVSSGVNIALGLDAEIPEATGKLSATQRGRVQQLLTDFRRASGNAGRLESTANKLLSIGGPAVSQLLVEINRQLQPQLKLYGEGFQTQAAAVQASRGGANMEEVEKLRAQVLALKEMPNLTKDMIVQQGDPAMAKLSEMLVVHPNMVLERSAKLRDERQKLLAIGRQWERASQQLIAEMQAQEAKAQSKSASKNTDKNADKNEPAAEPSEPPAAPNFLKYLEGEEELAAKMVMPMSEDARAVLAENGKLISQIETEEGRAILACNLMRQLLGLSVLKIDLKLCAASRDHSKDMATLNFFAHESPVPGKTTPWDRAKNFGTSASGENIAAGYADGNAANLGWFHSPGHHKNMLGNHKRIGLGVHNARYTELFGN